MTEGTSDFALAESFSKDFDIAGQPSRKYLGVGSYVADQIAGTITITATGTAPNWNTVVELQQLPILIWPPEFALFFTDHGIVLPAQRPFRVHAHFHSDKRIESVVVQDAKGRHVVKVRNF